MNNFSIPRDFNFVHEGIVCTAWAVHSVRFLAKKDIERLNRIDRVLLKQIERANNTLETWSRGETRPYIVKGVS